MSLDRGNRERVDGGREHLGSIPAQAGEPGCPGACQSEPRVYPRTGGGTGMRTVLAMAMYIRIGRGSIPAQAGEPRLRTPPCERGAPGLSPHRRGNPHVPDRLTAVPFWVYPRTGGGTPIRNLRRPGVVDGSIPAQAGEPSAREAEPGLGSIPAQAGEPFVPHIMSIGSIPAQAGEPLMAK